MGYDQCHKHSQQTSHENETSLLWVTCPKSVIGETSHGSYTSPVLLFLGNFNASFQLGDMAPFPKYVDCYHDVLLYLFLHHLFFGGEM